MPVLWLLSGISTVFAPEPSPTGLEWWRFKAANLFTGLEAMRPIVEIGQQSDPVRPIASGIVAPTVLLKLAFAALFGVVVARARVAKPHGE